MSAEKTDALTRIIERQLQSLPDSLEQRKQVLRDLLAITPVTWKHRSEIGNLLIDLQNHERRQTEFLSVLAS